MSANAGTDGRNTAQAKRSVSMVALVRAARSRVDVDQAQHPFHRVAYTGREAAGSVCTMTPRAVSSTTAYVPGQRQVMSEAGSDVMCWNSSASSAPQRPMRKIL